MKRAPCTGAPAAGGAVLGPAVPVRISPPVGCLPSVLVGLHPATRALIERGPVPGALQGGLHAAAASVSRSLVNAGASDEQILEVFRANPEGIGVFLRQRGERALRRVIAFTRRDTQGDSHARILGAVGEGPKRTILELELLDGPLERHRFEQDLWHHSSAWVHLFRLAGLAEPLERNTEALQALVGRTVGVRLEEQEPGKLRVARWLAPTAVEVIQEQYQPPPAPGTWNPPPGPEQPWGAPLAAMAARGVRVDPARWEAAGEALRARYALEVEQGVPGAVERLRDLESYLDAVLEAAVLDPEHRVRAVWRQGSWTTRITSSSPNLQGITNAGELRAAVVPAPGHLFVVADWRHSHYRIAAGLCGDPALLEALEPGRDLYSMIGGMLGMPPDMLRSTGKALGQPLLYGAGPKRLTEAHPPQAGAILTRPVADQLRQRFSQSFPELIAYRAGFAGLERFTTPLGLEVEVPEDKRNERAAMAGFIQALEADALRWAVKGSDGVMAGTGARIVLALHDELIWEVPQEHAQEAACRAESWMLECLGWVCSPCAPAVTVEVRSSWAKGASPATPATSRAAVAECRGCPINSEAMGQNK